MAQRGVTIEEVYVVLETGHESEARPPRLAREAVFTEGYEWNGRYYEHKFVKVIYAIDYDIVAVVTVIGMYGRWESPT